MKPALHAEWTKLRTVAGPLWLLLGTIALTVAVNVAVTSTLTCGTAGCGEDAAKLGLAGVDLGQAPVAILAVQIISSEYGSGMIRTTLTAIPHRATVLAAKALTLSSVVTVAGTVAVLGSLLAGRLILPGRGFTTAHGDAALSPTSLTTLRAAVGSILYLVLIALLSLGVATAVRDSATSIGIVLGLLYLFPILSQAIGDPHWSRLLQRTGPSPWAGLGVLAIWAISALAAGTVLLRVRDA